MQTSVIQINRFSGATFGPAVDELAIEEPLEIRVAHTGAEMPEERAISVTMRTPGADRDLALGFLFTEGLIRSYTDVREVVIAENTVSVHLAEGIRLQVDKAERNFYMSSSCGICGKASLDAVRIRRSGAPAHDGIRISPELFYSLPGRLRAR